jgi:prolyl-tRNA editing enzyme YbaK/EbsC (Cys-tRNA(Pro) deacylase)
MLDMIVRYLHEALVPFRLASYPSEEHLPTAGHATPLYAIAVESRVLRAGDKLVLACHPVNMLIDLAAISNELGAPVVEASPEDLPAILQGEKGPPPLGHLFGMPLIVDEEITHHTSIIFQPFDDSDYVEVPYDDFARLEQPRIASFARGGELPRAAEGPRAEEGAAAAH